MNSRLFIFCGLFLSLTQAVYAKGKLAVDGNNTQVEFLAVGNPSALKIKGTLPEGDTGAIKGELSFDGPLVTGTAKVRLSALDTGIELRDKHMKEKYLEVEKFPESELQITKLHADLNADVAKLESVPFEGVLDLHGNKKEIKGTTSVKKKDQHVSMAFEFKLKVSDFAIASPNFMGITMADEVTVRVKTQGKPS